MKRKKPPPEGAPLWMCTFGDLMSLLLCFFIMLFAISIISEVKLVALIETLERRQGYSGASPNPSEATTQTAPPAGIPEDSRRSASLVGSQPTSGRGGDFPSPQPVHPDGSPVRGGLIFFDLGLDLLNEKAESDLDLILPTLRSAQEKIFVKGHVGPAELEFSYFEREFYLAYSRAVVVKNYLMEQGISEENIQIGVADSATAPNRAVLPPGMEPRQAGASTAVYLLDGTYRN